MNLTPEEIKLIAGCVDAQIESFALLPNGIKKLALNEFKALVSLKIKCQAALTGSPIVQNRP